MKKIIALLLAVMMLMALCACGDSAEEAAAPADEAAAAPAVDAAPAEEAAGATGEMAGDATGEMASGEAGGAQSGNKLDLSENAVIPTKDAPETYSADEAGWVEYMLDCAYYAMGTADSDGKLGATYYDIKNGGMTDMFVNMWGVDTMDAFIANGGVPSVNPWELAEGQGTPETVPDAEETAE